jgi:hypothetical protein
MGTYAFRIQCRLAGSVFGTNERKFPLTLPALTSPIQVNRPERGSSTEGQSLILWCGGFTSEDEARAAGVRVKTAVMLAGVLLGFGIDVGTDQVISPAAQRRDGQLDEHLQPDVHGLQVMPEIEGRILFGSVRFGGLVPKNFPENFQKRVAESYALNKVLTKKQTLAAQLYNQSHFLSSDTARFVTLISAVEALSEQSNRSPVAVALIAQMIQMTAAAGDLKEGERKSLKDALGNLRRVSIGSTCRALVKMHCGAPAAKYFTRAYDIRSKLVHEGEPPPGTDLAAELRDLDTLVRHLVVKHVAGS